MAQAKIRFLSERKYDGGGVPQDARVFKAGEVYELDEDSARRWVIRNAAVYEELDPTTRGAVQVPPPDEEARKIGTEVGGGLNTESEELILQKANEQGKPTVDAQGNPIGETQDQATVAANGANDLEVTRETTRTTTTTKAPTPKAVTEQIMNKSTTTPQGQKSTTIRKK